MTSITTFDCDNCGRSIPDPGVKLDVGIEETTVKNGQQFIGTTKVAKELCSSCGNSLLKIIEKGLRGAKTA